MGSAPVRNRFEERLLYFSFVTLSTLGYGDLVPGSSPLKLFAPIEAIAGQLYLTILVARLVGLHIVHGASAAPESADENPDPL